MAKEATHTSGVGIPKSALMDAARNEKGWSNFTSRKYMDTCATKECDHKPSSNSGLCFKCYALLRAKE